MTQLGHVYLALSWSGKDKIVAVLSCCNVPVLLRKIYKYINDFVGEVYVYGHTNGEVIEG